MSESVFSNFTFGKVKSEKKRLPKLQAGLKIKKKPIIIKSKVNRFILHNKKYLKFEFLLNFRKKEIKKKRDSSEKKLHFEVRKLINFNRNVIKITNLPKQICPSQLGILFEKFGDILKIKILWKSIQKVRAKIYFRKRTAAFEAQKKMNGFNLEGKILKIRGY